MTDRCRRQGIGFSRRRRQSPRQSPLVLSAYRSKYVSGSRTPQECVTVPPPTPYSVSDGRGVPARERTQPNWRHRVCVCEKHLLGLYHVKCELCYMNFRFYGFIFPIYSCAFSMRTRLRTKFYTALPRRLYFFCGRAFDFSASAF